ncbi:hypothetical protein Vwe01_07270 [Micromonospora andamanensis]|nr:hypothetical protein Vwe01_07270 [Micromonospora andamanensis]
MPGGTVTGIAQAGWSAAPGQAIGAIPSEGGMTSRRGAVAAGGAAASGPAATGTSAGSPTLGEPSTGGGSDTAPS